MGQKREQEDFGEFLLGHQVDDSATGLEALVKNSLESELLEGALEFGQDAALPMVAENAPTPLALTNWNFQPTLLSFDRPIVEFAPVLPTDARFEPSGFGALSAPEKRDLKTLLQAKPEDLKLSELKDIIDKVWGDGKESKPEILSVKLEGVSPQARVDSGLDAAVRLEAKQNQEEKAKLDTRVLRESSRNSLFLKPFRMRLIQSYNNRPGLLWSRQRLRKSMSKIENTIRWAILFL